MSEAQVLEPTANQHANPHPESAQRPETLTERLNARIAEFVAVGDKIEWIEATKDALVRLFLESGEEIVSLDPDPEVDRAWYGGFELRKCPRDGLWVYRSSANGRFSGHLIS